MLQLTKSLREKIKSRPLSGKYGFRVKIKLRMQNPPFFAKTLEWFEVRPHRCFQTDKNLLRTLRMCLKDPENINGFAPQ